ncbi:hypothetical protein GUJ93_ZPchr0001g30327 [Zizania palustris]|uniref:Uncharacterized protein n=1 Tax=Zizania palustris TaxID=103762 RepID=A0A8J5RLH7_ZIZPA|nr:hypothetical protein GUJ93_ZPchr0001g30327 [Zizania palustris]
MLPGAVQQQREKKVKGVASSSSTEYNAIISGRITVVSTTAYTHTLRSGHTIIGCMIAGRGAVLELKPFCSDQLCCLQEFDAR